MQTQNLSSQSPTTALPAVNGNGSSPTDEPNAPGQPVANGVAPVAQSTAPTCAACGGENSVDSRFCRHCGATMAPVVAPVMTTDAATAAILDSTNEDVAPSDRQRSRQLLDRAFLLAERGDMKGAVGSCRQAISLAPDAAQGYSMLGLLLERAGDPAQAMIAYQKALQLAPDSRLEQESVQRLQSAVTQRQQAVAPAISAPPLAAPIPSPAVPIAAAPVVATPVVAAPIQTAPSATPFDPLVPLVQPPPPFVAAPPITTPYANPGTPLSSTMSGLGLSTSSQPVWKNLAAQPSFYFRGVPLVAATSLGLMWMILSRSSAPMPAVAGPVISDPVNPTSAVVDYPNNSTPIAAPNTAAPNLAPLPGVAPAGSANSFPLQNRNLPSVQREAAARRAAAARAAATNAANANRNSRNATTNTNAPSSPQFPRPAAPPSAVPSLPRPVPPADTRSLPPAATNPLPPISPAMPPVNTNNSGGGSSSGGAPLNPAGSGEDNYISVGRGARPSISSAPVRPANRSTALERRAASDRRAGRSESAIGNLTASMNAGGDSAWRYQQRALAFLERGDNQRAADDFQSALAAYNRQIERGERIAEARSGINACRSGLRLALSNLKR